MTAVTRRAFLMLAALLAPASPLRASTPQTPAISVDDFLRLSQRLVGRSTLDGQAAAVYLEALLAVPANAPLLAELARGTASTAAHVALERTIVEWWYTGTYVRNGEPRLATHTGALMWRALGMPAPGTCAGTFGAWSRPPRPTA